MRRFDCSGGFNVWGPRSVCELAVKGRIQHLVFDFEGSSDSGLCSFGVAQPPAEVQKAELANDTLCPRAVSLCCLNFVHALLIRKK